MQIILLDNIIGIGKKSDIVNVKAGYARNYLIPKNKGIPATKANIHILKNKIKNLELQSLQIFKQAETKSKNFLDMIHNITITSRSSKTGKLFGSINKNDIVLTLKNMNFPIEKKMIILPNGPIRHLGKHEVHFQFHEKIIIKKNINIINYNK